MKKIFLLISIFISFVINAQNTNLIQNGSFEQYYIHLGKIKFDGWYFHRNLNVEKVQGHNDNNAAKVYTNYRTFSVAKSGNYNIIPIEGNAKYQLSFWIKGKTGEENIKPIIFWYEDDNKLGDGVELQKSKVTTEWTQKTYTFTSPQVANKAALSFSVFDKGEFITIDDVSLIKTGSGDLVGKPTGLEAIPFQREIEISWHKGKPNTKWEVVVDEISTVVDTNIYVVTKLIPNSNHKIKVRTLINGETSDFTDELNIQTSSFDKGKDEALRVPFLRTLTEDGTPEQVIDLYYNELYNENAEIKYFIDDKPILPENNQLTFPKKGKQMLKVIIKEGEGYEWEIEYKLNVK